jgi:hypothetical protein
MLHQYLSRLGVMKPMSEVLRRKKLSRIKLLVIIKQVLEETAVADARI